MIFNLDPPKQEKEVICSRKIQIQDQPIIYFNQNPVMQTNSQKQLGFLEDTQGDFKEHLTKAFTKANKNFGLRRKFQNILPTIC